MYSSRLSPETADVNKRLREFTLRHNELVHQEDDLRHRVNALHKLEHTYEKIAELMSRIGRLTKDAEELEASIAEHEKKATSAKN